jgi:hypothetical protein
LNAGNSDEKGSVSGESFKKNSNRPRIKTQRIFRMGLLDTLLGNTSASRLKKLQPYIQRINAIEPQMKAMTDEQLRAQTVAFRERLKNGETLDDIMVEAFATVREAAVRTVDMRHFDVQLLGGMVLHQGRISEMKTGEGKTLVATLPAYLNALTVQGVHVVTVNDYLAKRDAQWMGKIYRFLAHERRLRGQRHGARGKAGGLQRGHHLRHQQRVWFRLSARQHGRLSRADGAARDELCHHRRGWTPSSSTKRVPR